MNGTALDSLAEVTRLPTISPAVMSVLIVTLGASLWTFHLLTQRWTRDRSRTLLAEWAGERRYELRWSPRTVLPPVLRRLGATAEVPTTLTRDGLSLLRILAPTGTWHLLLKQTELVWTPAALRPRHAGNSLADAFELPGFPAVLASERFVVCAAESRAARRMAAAPARGLLPPDIGLLVHGSYVMLDFSHRPFDVVEFDRMLAVMEQLNGHLPAPTSLG